MLPAYQIARPLSKAPVNLLFRDDFVHKPVLLGFFCREIKIAVSVFLHFFKGLPRVFCQNLIEFFFDLHDFYHTKRKAPHLSLAFRKDRRGAERTQGPGPEDQKRPKSLSPKNQLAGGRTRSHRREPTCGQACPSPHPTSNHRHRDTRRGGPDRHRNP